MPNSAATKTTQIALSRRNIISAAASGALVLALGVPSFALASKAQAPAGGALYVDPLTLLDASLAQAFIGSDFDISSDTAYAKLRLSKVDANLVALKKAGESGTKSFAMEFEVLSNAGIMQQDIYHVVHPKLGAFDLLLVPHVNGKGNRVFVATFSRIK